MYQRVFRSNFLPEPLKYEIIAPANANREKRKKVSPKLM